MYLTTVHVKNYVLFALTLDGGLALLSTLEIQTKFMNTHSA